MQIAVSNSYAGFLFALQVVLLGLKLCICFLKMAAYKHGRIACLEGLLALNFGARLPPETPLI